jgi:hypothetical protein
MISNTYTRQQLAARNRHDRLEGAERARPAAQASRPSHARRHARVGFARPAAPRPAAVAPCLRMTTTRGTR